MKKIEITMIDDSHCDITIDGVESKGHYVEPGMMGEGEFALLALCNALEYEPSGVFLPGVCGM